MAPDFCRCLPEVKPAVPAEEMGSRQFWIDDVTQRVSAPWNHTTLGIRTMPWPDSEKVIRVIEYAAFQKLQKRIKELESAVMAGPIPVLKMHDAKALIGFCETLASGVIEVNMLAGFELTEADLFDTFGNAGLMVYEMVQGEKEILFKKFTITNFSVGPKVDRKNLTAQPESRRE